MQYYETDEVNLQVFSQFKDLQKTVYCLGFIILHSKLDIFNWIFSLCMKILRF